MDSQQLPELHHFVAAGTVSDKDGNVVMVIAEPTLVIATDDNRALLIMDPRRVAAG